MKQLTIAHRTGVRSLRTRYAGVFVSALACAFNSECVVKGFDVIYDCAGAGDDGGYENAAKCVQLLLDT